MLRLQSRAGRLFWNRSIATAGLDNVKTPHLVLCFLAALFGCAFYFDSPPKLPDTPEQVTITYWEKWTGFEGEAMKNTIHAFNEKKIKNAKGQVIYCKCLSTTEVDRKSLLSISGGHPPDLAGVWLFNTHIFADMGAFMPLDPFIERDDHKGRDPDKDGRDFENFNTSNYLPVYWKGCQHRGVTWVLPTTPATVALHWNKDLFRDAGLDPDRPPLTMKELEEYNAKLTKYDAEGRLIQIGFLPPEPGWWNWGWGYYFGGKLNEDNLEKITATDPKNIQALKWIVSFNHGEKAEQLLAWKQGFGTFDSPQNAFISGKVAMVLQGVWMANFVRFNRPSMNWGCGPFPSNLPLDFPNRDEPVTFADMDVIAIPRGCKHPEEAWEVIKFINTHEGMEMVCKGQGKLTPFKENTPGWIAGDAKRGIEPHPHPYLKVFIDLAKSKNALSIPKLEVWNEYAEEMKVAFDKAFLNKLTPEEALQEVQDRMQPKLDRALEVLRARAGKKGK